MYKSRFRFLPMLLPVLLFCARPPSVRAQALPTASGPGPYVAIGEGLSVFQANYGARSIAGNVAYADINPTWRYGVEAEARFLRLHTSEDVTETNYFVGPRVALRPGRLRPYVKFLVGAGRIDLPFHLGSGTFFTFAPGGGLDYWIGDRLNLRVIDFEYQMWPQVIAGPLRPYGLTTGLSFRLNSLSRFPRSRR